MRIDWCVTCLLVLAACHKPSDLDCKTTSDCKTSGLCTAQDNKCVAGNDVDCRASSACASRGACGLAPATATCVATSDEDCKQSSACTGDHTAFAPCALIAARGRCDSQACARSGLCVVETTDLVDESGNTVSGTSAPGVGEDADCRASTDCADFGRCAVAGDVCGATTDADCAASKQCATKGMCKLNAAIHACVTAP